MSRMSRRFGSLQALGGAGACLLMLGVACGDESKHDANTSGGSAGAAGSAAVSSGGAAANAGSAGVPAFSEGGASEGGTGGGEASAGAAGAAGASVQCAGVRSLFASSVRDYELGSGQSFGQDKFPSAVLGPPRGGGCCGDSMDVTSLGDGGW